MRRAEAELERGGARASNAAVAERTRLSVITVRSLRVAGRVTASLDVPVGEDSTPLGNLMSDDRAVDPSKA